MPTILVIDDERAIRNTLRDILEYEKYTIDEAEDGLIGIEKVKNNEYDCVLCDIKMPKKDGVEVLEAILNEKPELPVIMISGHGTLETAVDCIRKGAYDYIAKPLDLNRLLVSVKNALDKNNLVEQTKQLKKKVQSIKSSKIIGESQPIQAILDLVQKVAPSDARVLITGPNGSGKELVAQQLHELSTRAKAPFIEVNCAAIPSELIESELFGHEKGAFTSAIKQRKGKFELADGGTLFLDEIGDMSASAQAKVLRALQENKITRVGGDKEIKVDVRVIAATNKNLKEEIAANRFREDLYHRLSVILIEVPPLNDRKEDLPLLVDHFLTLIANDQGKAKLEISTEALDRLKEYDFSGNIRELRNIVERLTILCSGTIDVDSVNTYVMR